jgi:hypothetical protein
MQAARIAIRQAAPNTYPNDVFSPMLPCGGLCRPTEMIHIVAHTLPSFLDEKHAV